MNKNKQIKYIKKVNGINYTLNFQLIGKDKMWYKLISVYKKEYIVYDATTEHKREIIFDTADKALKYAVDKINNHYKEYSKNTAITFTNTTLKIEDKDLEELYKLANAEVKPTILNKNSIGKTFLLNNDFPMLCIDYLPSKTIHYQNGLVDTLPDRYLLKLQPHNANALDNAKEDAGILYDENGKPIDYEYSDGTSFIVKHQCKTIIYNITGFTHNNSIFSRSFTNKNDADKVMITYKNQNYNVKLIEVEIDE